MENYEKEWEFWQFIKSKGRDLIYDIRAKKNETFCSEISSGIDFHAEPILKVLKEYREFLELNKGI